MEVKDFFYCKSCVNNGLFVHSKGCYPDRYREKFHRYEILQKEKQHKLERIEGLAKGLTQKDKQKCEIEACKERIKLLKLAICAAKEQKQKGKETLEKQRRDNYTKVMKTRRHSEKKKRIFSYIDSIKSSNTEKIHLCQEKKKELTIERQRQTQLLVHFIFEVKEVALVSESDSMAVSTVSALREASHTAYLRGHWVYTDGSGEAQYRIVEPTLPCSGDYSAYSLWVAASQESGGNPDNSLRNPGHRISAALCYTSQMVAILSHLLDVRLPRKQPYSDFCTNELTEKQFKSCVACLNQNVLYLCFSQGVDHPELLDPRNTLQNVVSLLYTSTLGRNSFFEIDRDLMASVEDSIIVQEEDSEPTSGEDELAGDWEQVSEDITDGCEFANRLGYTSTLSNIQTMSYPARTQDQLTTSGFVTSAATSFMSLFRGADKT